MSAGAFSDVFYESTELDGAILNARVQPETLELTINSVANSGATGPADFPLLVNISGGRREYGVKPRKVTIRFTDDSDLPDGYTGDDLIIPVLTPTAYAAYAPGNTGTYLGSPVRVVSRTPEFVR